MRQYWRADSPSENSTIKELLLSHPEALRVLLERGVPATCAEGTIAEAARACGLSPAALLAELRAAIDAKAGAVRDRARRDLQTAGSSPGAR